MNTANSINLMSDVDTHDLLIELVERFNEDSRELDSLEQQIESKTRECEDLKANALELHIKADQRIEEAQNEVDQIKKEMEVLANENKLLTFRETTYQDKIVSLEKEIDELQKFKQLKDGKDTQFKKLEKEISKLRVTLNQKNQQLESYSGIDIKEITKKNATLKNRNKELLDAKSLLQRENSAYRAENKLLRDDLDGFEKVAQIQASRIKDLEYTTTIGYSQAIYANHDDRVMIALLPQKMLVRVDGIGKTEEQHHLLFSDMLGIWKQVSLAPNGELSVARSHSTQFSERTQKTIESVLPQPNDKYLKFMHEWLLRVRDNKWQVTDVDVLSLQRGEIVSKEELEAEQSEIH